MKDLSNNKESAKMEGLVQSRIQKFMKVRAASLQEPLGKGGTPTTGRLLRPPRQASGTEGDDSAVHIDRTTYLYMSQDVTNMKTMLLKLKRVLHEAETLNPFGTQMKPASGGLYVNLASSDPPAGLTSGDPTSDLVQENADLRRQVVLLQQQLEEKDRTVRLLQQQMVKYSSSSLTSAHHTSNAATQTDRSRSVSSGRGSPRSLSGDDVRGSTISTSD